MFNFIEHLLKVTSIVESPTSYIEWAGYVTISSVLRHNLYYSVPSRRTKITPNLYVLIVGDSGATRKSTPLKICNYLLKRVGNTKLIEGRASIQGVLKELAEVKMVHEPVKRRVEHASALLYSEEFAGFIVKDPATTAILTDIYDYHETHDIVLKSSETLTLKHVCVNILSATNAAFMQDLFTKQDLYGGLVGRTIFIIEEKARLKNLGLRDTSTDTEWEPLIRHLHTLIKLSGAVQLTEPALSFMEEWYETTDFTLGESKTGYEHRAHTHALKLALILAACKEGFQMVVDIDDCVQAVEIVTTMRKNYHKLVASAGASTNLVVQAAKDITVYIFTNTDKILTKETILRGLFGKVDADTFDKGMSTLIQSGIIQAGGSNIPTYELTERGKEMILGELKPKPLVN